jgi:hypothetical protein
MERAFEAAYDSSGSWAELFRHDPEFLGTDLLRGSDGTYLTLDRWTSEAAFRSFRERFPLEYAALDARCEAMVESESSLGTVEV